jgi:hypothetical protein
VKVTIFQVRGPVAPLTAGASGAVFGALGLILGWLVYSRDRRWRSFAVQAVFYALVLNLLGMSINNEAHLVGLLCGAAFGFYYASRPRPKSLLLANIGAIVGLLLSVASLLLAQRSAQWGKDPLPMPDAQGPPPAAPSLSIRSTTRSARRTPSPGLIPPTRSPSNLPSPPLQEIP